MRLCSHIFIGMNAVNNNGVKLGFIKKFAFILGNILPDIYIPIKRHHCWDSIKNISYHLDKLEKSDKYGIIRYLRLGMTMHYVCDYFCRAHNDPTMHVNAKHVKYEFALGDYIDSHKEDVSELLSEINENSEFVEEIQQEHLKYLKEMNMLAWNYWADMLYSCKICTNMFKRYAV